MVREIKAMRHDSFVYLSVLENSIGGRVLSM